jgi:hypothetical protein
VALYQAGGKAKLARGRQETKAAVASPWGPAGAPGSPEAASFAPASRAIGDGGGGVGLRTWAMARTRRTSPGKVAAGLGSVCSGPASGSPSPSVSGSRSWMSGVSRLVRAPSAFGSPVSATIRPGSATTRKADVESAPACGDPALVATCAVAAGLPAAGVRGFALRAPARAESRAAKSPPSLFGPSDAGAPAASRPEETGARTRATSRVKTKNRSGFTLRRGAPAAPHDSCPHVATFAPTSLGARRELKNMT